MRDSKASSTVSGIGRWLERETHRLKAQVQKAMLRARLGDAWQSDEADAAFTRRAYPDYATYLKHQRLKLDAHRPSSLERHDRRFYQALQQRLPTLPVPVAGLRVLCLAARQGTEVRAFIDAGAFAVGIDLNPGRRNEYVLSGDFHALQFAAGTVDLVYTNSLDHAFELDRVLGEVKRVLVPDGLLLLEVGAGSGPGGTYESLAWSSVTALLARTLPHGFALVHRSPFSVPWNGETLLLRRVGAQPAPSDRRLLRKDVEGSC